MQWGHENTNLKCRMLKYRKQLSYHVTKCWLVYKYIKFKKNYQLTALKHWITWKRWATWNTEPLENTESLETLNHLKLKYCDCKLIDKFEPIRMWGISYNTRWILTAKLNIIEQKFLLQFVDWWSFTLMSMSLDVYCIRHLKNILFL